MTGPGRGVRYYWSPVVVLLGACALIVDPQTTRVEGPRLFEPPASYYAVAEEALACVGRGPETAVQMVRSIEWIAVERIWSEGFVGGEIKGWHRVLDGRSVIYLVHPDRPDDVRHELGHVLVPSDPRHEDARWPCLDPRRKR